MSVIYFIRAGEAGPIKIGFTRGDPLKRMFDLQAGCPWPLNLIGSVAAQKPHEKWLHETLFKHRLMREWFESCPEVLETINRTLSPEFSWSEAGLCPLNQAIVRAGSQLELERAIGIHTTTISIARKNGMGPRLRSRVEAFLREVSA